MQGVAHGLQASHGTMPATPSTATCAPSGMRRLASSAPSTGCRQAGLGQHRKICSLRADASRVGRCGIVERNDVIVHR